MGFQTAYSSVEVMIIAAEGGVPREPPWFLAEIPWLRSTSEMELRMQKTWCLDVASARSVPSLGLGIFHGFLFPSGWDPIDFLVGC